MRILILSDIHANLAALQAVLAEAGDFDQVWCLGDVVGYGPEPNGCIDQLRALQAVCLAGNHDLAVVGRTGLWDFTQHALDVIFWTRHTLTTSNLDWLTELPATPCVREAVTLVHGSLRDPVWEYLVTREIARENLELLSTPVCLHGHSHIPAMFRKPWDGPKILEEPLRVNAGVRLATYDQVFLNPGSVGQPRDEDPRAAYALLDLDSLTFTLRRVAYDVNATQKAMRQAQLPERLIRRLRLGQ